MFHHWLCFSNFHLLDDQYHHQPHYSIKDALKKVTITSNGQGALPYKPFTVSNMMVLIALFFIPRNAKEANNPKGIVYHTHGWTPPKLFRGFEVSHCLRGRQSHSRVERWEHIWILIFMYVIPTFLSLSTSHSYDRQKAKVVAWNTLIYPPGNS